jgi:hypothetical protein
MFKFYFDKEQEEFDKLRSANKITYEFSVNSEEKDVFVRWVYVLAEPEFMVDVDLKNIVTKKFKNPDFADYTLFRIKASGEKKDLDRWRDNLDCVRRFLNGEYNIDYTKKRSDSNAN